MKKVSFIVVLCMLVMNISFAQTSGKGTGVPKNGEYRRINVLNAFAGTWEWTSGKDSFQVMLKKIRKKELSIGTHAYYTDMIQGGYLYVKAGKAIINTLKNTDDFEAASILGPTEYDSEKIKVKFNDMKKGKIADAILLLDKNKRYIIWELRQLSETININKQRDTTYSVPSDIRLSKVDK